MEEEGTVVYFKTSPSVCDIPDNDELVFREEYEDSNIYEPIMEHAHSSDKRQSTPSVFTQQEGRRLQILRWVLNLVFDAWTMVQRWLLLKDQYDSSVKYRSELLDCISNSPLLTEDDFQLVQFIFSNSQKHCSTEQTHQLPQKFSQNHKQSISLVTILVGIVIATTAMLSPLSIFLTVVSTFVVAIVTIVGVTVARWQMKVVAERRLGKTIASVKTYLREFESLLSLITQTTRIIRETEIVSHGFSRPAPTVPISKLEGQGATSFQCQLLRRKLFKVCRDAICSLKSLTQQLVSDFKSREEFDNQRDYLAFRKLSTLHQFMSEDELNLNDQLSFEEQKDSPPAESLESLKDACNLLAVQNSEMLRRLAIVLSSAGASNGQDKGYIATVLTTVVKYITPHCQLVCRAKESLRWSVNFHKNYLFGEPPSAERRSAGSKKDGSYQTGYHPLEVSAQEIHCMDLKTQVTLKRIRSLGSWLSKTQKSEIVESDGSGMELLEHMRQRLSTIEQELGGVMEHIEECYRSLNKVDKLKVDDEEGCDPPLRESELPDHVEEEETANPTHGEKEECSDDEVVFEAYVSPSEVVADQDEDGLPDEDLKIQKESRENSLRMMKELNSILAVRNVEKQRRRELRERKKQGHSVSQEEASINSHLPPNSQPKGEGTQLPVIQKVGVTIACGNESTVPTSATNKKKESEIVEREDSENEKVELPFVPLHSSNEQLQCSSSSAAAIAQAVAAAALRAGRTGREEQFYDEDFCPTSEDEEHSNG